MWSDPKITEISIAPSKSLSLCKFERTENLTFVCSIGKFSVRNVCTKNMKSSHLYIQIGKTSTVN